MIIFATENREKVMKRSLFPIILLMATLQATAQQVVQNKQRHFPKTVPAGNYSGIAWLGGDKYAVANDKSKTAGFHLMTIRTDAKTGDIKEVRADGFMTNGQPNRDEEGICYVPQTNTVFLSSETDGQIIEYSMNGELTGRRLRIPHVYTMAYNNRSFEALTYNATTRRFWTTTENTLKCDGYKPTIINKEVNVVRLQSFGDDLEPLEQYWYMSDSTSTQELEGKSILGVSGMAALDNGLLIILERELVIKPKEIGSYVHEKLYVVNPTQQQPGDLLQKQLLTEFRTRINLTDRSFANFEGICLGPKLADGRRLLLLVSDSQDQYKGYMKDWFKSIVIPDLQFTPTPVSSKDYAAFLHVFNSRANIDADTFLSPEEMPDFRKYITAPPAPDSELFQGDRYYYEWGKAQRNTPRGLQAAIDEVIWLPKAFSPVVGFYISLEETPEIFKLAEGAMMYASVSNRKAKDYYRRIRPFVYFNEPSLVSATDSVNMKSYSYPSGHSVRGWMYAFTLALVVPDATEELMKRAEEYAMSRIICGRHYKSDIEASLVEATAILSRLLSNEAFTKQLSKAREEYQSKFCCPESSK